jgi:hypothetical protein
MILKQVDIDDLKKRFEENKLEFIWQPEFSLTGEFELNSIYSHIRYYKHSNYDFNDPYFKWERHIKEWSYGVISKNISAYQG